MGQNEFEKQNDTTKQSINVKTKVEDNVASNLNQSFSTPSNVASKMFFNHLGVITNNLCIFSCVAAILCFFSFLIVLAYIVFLIMSTLATAGTIFIMIPNFAEWWEVVPKVGEMVGSTSAFSLWLFVGAIISSVTSLALMLASGELKSRKRIICAIVILIVSIIGLVFTASVLIGG